MRPRSLRIMSTIMTFSARFFGEARSHAAERSSSSRVLPLGAVPFIGRLTIRSASSRKKSSGDAEQRAHLPRSTKAQHLDRWPRTNAAKSGQASPVKGASRRKV